ncbi:uncharacterized protein cd34 [Gadus chalcogrammus]|uniref:uncharacterized protein cd34 n=1 Tax=Gadus chalcogrammus TaxID=1042646 RepID=UPI0024C3E6F4|nr:uncharacterized protein cd34 [Gadus chalcogrammus]
MATAMWRMNGAGEKMSGAALLLLGALLLNNGLMCLGDETEAPTVMDASLDATTGAPDSPAPVVPEATSETPVRADATTGAVTGPPLAVSVITDVGSLLEVAAQETGKSTPEPAAVPSDATDAPAAPTDLETKAPETKAPLKLVVPVVNCVVKEGIKAEHVKAVVTTSTCEETMVALRAAPAAWCAAEVCRLDVSQDGNTILVASPDATPSVIKAALQGEKIKESLGVSGVESSSSGPGASVFVGVLLTGLLVAAGLIGGYCFKNRRTPGDKGTRLAEEAYPVDVENQGNTLVSVAPLNPPPETQEPAETTEIPEPKEPAEVPEKPIENGEAPEEVKVDPPPPTNGTSTAAKTADTEL